MSVKRFRESCRGRSYKEVAAGLTVPLVAKEDAILSKLLWIKLGSGKSKRDVIQMLKNPEDLDFSQLRLQAARLGLADVN